MFENDSELDELLELAKLALQPRLARISSGKMTWETTLEEKLECLNQMADAAPTELWCFDDEVYFRGPLGVRGYPAGVRVFVGVPRVAAVELCEVVSEPLARRWQSQDYWDAFWKWRWKEAREISRKDPMAITPEYVPVPWPCLFTELILAGTRRWLVEFFPRLSSVHLRWVEQVEQDMGPLY
jgi:hypothetical protein